jgi:hypothetical protein
VIRVTRLPAPVLGFRRFGLDLRRCGVM